MGTDFGDWSDAKSTPLDDLKAVSKSVKNRTMIFHPDCGCLLYVNKPEPIGECPFCGFTEPKDRISIDDQIELSKFCEMENRG